MYKEICIEFDKTGCNRKFWYNPAGNHFCDGVGTPIKDMLVDIDGEFKSMPIMEVVKQDLARYRTIDIFIQSAVIRIPWYSLRIDDFRQIHTKVDAFPAILYWMEMYLSHHWTMNDWQKCKYFGDAETFAKWWVQDFIPVEFDEWYELLDFNKVADMALREEGSDFNVVIGIDGRRHFFANHAQKSESGGKA